LNTEIFTGKAEVYAKARPGYPEAAMEYIRELMPPDAVIADIGAGTGKFTLSLARYRYHIFAVEPNTDMRGELIKTLTPFPNVKVVDGSGWLQYMASHSHDPLPSDPGYDKHIAEVNAIFDSENVDGLICREVVTKVYSEKVGASL